MSEKERVLKKHTDLRDTLAANLEFELKDTVNTYNERIKDMKEDIEKLSERLNLDDNAFLEALYHDDVYYLVNWIKDRAIRLLQGDFTQSFFEYSYGAYMKDEQIDPTIRNKLKEIHNKVIEYEKDPLIQRFNNALEKFEIKRDILYVDIVAIDDKLIKLLIKD